MDMIIDAWVELDDQFVVRSCQQVSSREKLFQGSCFEVRQFLLPGTLFINLVYLEKGKPHPLFSMRYNY